MEILQIIWFILLTVLFAGYALLDGFDLGVGVLHFFAKNETEKRLNMNAIGPVWDGNEVWLLTAGGAMFAAFPIVYATVFSGFYIALMLLLFALILRAVSMEFRSKIDSESWKKVWDFAFAIGSLLPAILFGVAFGNILRGIPLNSLGVFTGSFLGLLNPYSILVGILSLLMCVTHGALFLTLKSGEEYQDKYANLAVKSWLGYVAFYVIVTIATFFSASYLLDGILGNVLFWVFFLSFMVSVVYIPVAIKAQKYTVAFTASSVSIISLISIAAVSLFPRLVPSSINLDYSLTIFNASSTQNTLTTMLIIALIGMPIVIGYTIFIYRMFKGRTSLGENSY